MLDLFKTMIADFHARAIQGRVVQRDLVVPLKTNKVVSIIGPRRAGKTWFLYSLIEKLRQEVGIHNMVHINFEDERLALDASSFGLIIDAYQQLYSNRPLDKVYFFLDEIQNIPGWEKFVRRLAETISPHVFLTGSSARLLNREIAGALRGRALPYALFPLSFREYLRFQGVEACEFRSTSGRNRMEAMFDRFLLEGGYPETLAMDEPTRTRTLQSYFEIMLYRDIVERHAVRRPYLVKDLARRMLAGNAQVFSVHKYYRDLRSRNIRVTKDALYALTDHFADALFVVPVSKSDPSAAKQSQALKKYYVNDTGLLNACLFITAENRGAQLETFVLLELRKREKEAVYFSEANECDFLILDKGAVTEAIQVCHQLTEDNRRRELAGLKSAMVRFGLKHGTVLTRRQKEDLQTDVGRIRILPAWEWSLTNFSTP